MLHRHVHKTLITRLVPLFELKVILSGVLVLKGYVVTDPLLPPHQTTYISVKRTEL